MFSESAEKASWSARLAAAEVPVAILWASSLLGLLVTVLLAPHVALPAAVTIIGIEVALTVAAMLLSWVWLKNQRTPVVEADALVLESAFDARRVPFAEIQRVEIVALQSGERACSRVSVVRHDGDRLRMDLPSEDALLLCRTLQRRLFGGGAPAPYDPSFRTLDRDREAVSAWVSRLRERFGKSGYRHAAGIAEDELDRALHDAALSASRRIGAALALQLLGGAEGTESLRRIAAHLETDALRIAVLRVADGDLDEQTLAAAEAEDEALGRVPPGAVRAIRD